MRNLRVVGLRLFGLGVAADDVKSVVILGELGLTAEDENGSEVLRKYSTEP